MRDIRDCLIKAMLISSPSNKYAELETWKLQDVYKINWDDIDPLAIAQNLTCEIEKMMAIFQIFNFCRILFIMKPNVLCI
jgi:hypothetical protein